MKRGKFGGRSLHATDQTKKEKCVGIMAVHFDTDNELMRQTTSWLLETHAVASCVRPALQRLSRAGGRTRKALSPCGKGAGSRASASASRAAGSSSPSAPSAACRPRRGRAGPCSAWHRAIAPVLFVWTKYDSTGEGGRYFCLSNYPVNHKFCKIMVF